MKPIAPFTFHPTKCEEMLLTAALSERSKASIAFRNWQAEVDWLSIEQTSVRLFPFVFNNLGEAIDPSLYDIFKGVHRKTWCGNQLLLDAADPVLQALNDMKLSYLLLKGVALLSKYKSLGLRRNSDIDLLAHPESLPLILSCLADYGWKPLIKYPALKSLRYRHSTSFRSDQGFEIDVHSTSCLETLNFKDEEEIWTNQVSCQIQGKTYNVPAETEQLLIVCLHGIRRLSPVGRSAIHWIPDALLLLEKPGKIDWNRLVAGARKRELSYQLASALVYLKTHFHSPIPDNVIRELVADRMLRRARVKLALSKHPFYFTFAKRGRFRELKRLLLGFFVFLIRHISTTETSWSKYCRTLFLFPSFCLFYYDRPNYRQLSHLFFSCLARNFQVQAKNSLWPSWLKVRRLLLNSEVISKIILQKFIQMQSKEKCTNLTPLCSGLSKRKYFRAQLQSTRSLILCVLSNNFCSPHVFQFTECVRNLKALQMPIPTLYSSSKLWGFILSEDLGSEKVTDYLAKLNDSERWQFISKDILELLLKLQSVPTLRKTRIRKYQLNHFTNKFISCYAEKYLEKKALIAIEAFTEELLDRIYGTPFVFSHGDFKGENLMVHQNSLRMIDFQDAGFRPMMFDIASFFEDPDLNMSDFVINEFLSLYSLRCSSTQKRAEWNLDIAKLRASYLDMAIFRHMMIIGTYASFLEKEHRDRLHTLIVKSLTRLVELSLRVSDVGYSLRALQEAITEHVFFGNTKVDVARPSI